MCKTKNEWMTISHIMHFECESLTRVVDTIIVQTNFETSRLGARDIHSNFRFLFSPFY